MALRQTESFDAEPETAPATRTTRFYHCEEMEAEDVERTMLRKQLATSRSAFWGYSTVLAKVRNALAHTEAELVTTRAMQEQRLSTLNVNNALLTMLTSAAEESSAELDAYHAKLVRKVFTVCDETYYGPKLEKLKNVMAEAQALIMDLKIIPAAIQSLGKFYSTQPPQHAQTLTGHTDPTTRDTVLSAIQKQKEALEQEYNDSGAIVS